MNSLFNTAHNEEIINRINHLTASSSALWGKMNVSQMLAHNQQPLHVAFGELQLKRGIIALLFGKMIKKKLIENERPFDHNLPTDKIFLITDQRVFENEKNKLIEMVKRFAMLDSNVLRKDPHPFFGKLSPVEWDILQWKHLDHHLRQFGV